MSKELDELAVQVARNAAVIQDAAALISKLAAQSPGRDDDDSTKLRAIVNAMNASSATLAAATDAARSAVSK